MNYHFHLCRRYQWMAIAALSYTIVTAVSGVPQSLAGTSANDNELDNSAPMEELPTVKEADVVGELIEIPPELQIDLTEYEAPSTIAPTDRALVFRASVSPVKGSEGLFEPFEVLPQELQMRNDASLIHVIKTEPAGRPIHRRTSTVPEYLEAERVPLSVHDEQLAGALKSLVDEKLVESFFAHHGLAPPLNKFKGISRMEDGKLVVSVSAHGIPTLTTAAPVNHAGEAAMIRDLTRSWMEHIGFENLKMRMPELIPPQDMAEYFPTGEISREGLIRYLRGYADIQLTEPKELRASRLQRHNDEVRARLEEQDRLLIRRYLKEHNLGARPESFRIQKDFQAAGLAITIQSDHPGSTFYHNVLLGVREGAPQDAVEQHIAQIIAHQIEITGLYDLERRLDEFVSEKDRQLYFGDPEANFRQNLLDYLSVKAAPSHNDI